MALAVGTDRWVPSGSVAILKPLASATLRLRPPAVIGATILWLVAVVACTGAWARGLHPPARPPLRAGQGTTALAGGLTTGYAATMQIRSPVAQEP